MDTVAAVARQRAVMNTIADLIVAAATGRSLRVAVGCTHPHETGFADQLTRALHARGRPCRCLQPKADPVTGDASTPAESRVSNPTMIVITSGSPDAGETDLCRIDIELHAPIPVTASVGSPYDEADGQDRCTSGRHEPDIIVDYLDPNGPTIRRIRPTLTSRPGQQ